MAGTARAARLSGADGVGPPTAGGVRGEGDEEDSDSDEGCSGSGVASSGTRGNRGGGVVVLDIAPSGGVLRLPYGTHLDSAFTTVATDERIAGTDLRRFLAAVMAAPTTGKSPQPPAKMA
mmetsp:Transcript_14066/g.41911  ORF Transcript_14066/g.41911 Transcript_14066/m.41911 type:complete len:120 (-) Transcript_14066:3-362(-)